MVRFQCDCGKNLSAKPSLAGRRVKCPGCGETVLVPAPPTTSAPERQHSSSRDEPETNAFNDLDSPSERVVSDVRKLVQYWRDENNTDGSLPPFDERNLPKKIEKLGEPEALFTADSVRTFVSQLGCGVFGSLLVLSLMFGGLALANDELREDHPWIVVLAVIVALASIVGWVLASRAARKDAKRFALLFPNGFAVCHPDNNRFYAWSDIVEVVVKPETRQQPGLVIWGHQFIVKTKEGQEEVLRMEYNAVLELGLVIMERAAAKGATCSGKVRREQTRKK